MAKLLFNSLSKVTPKSLGGLSVEEIGSPKLHMVATDAGASLIYGTIIAVKAGGSGLHNVFAGYQVPSDGAEIVDAVLSCEPAEYEETCPAFEAWAGASRYPSLKEKVEPYPHLVMGCNYPKVHKRGGYCDHIAIAAAHLAEKPEIMKGIMRGLQALMRGEEAPAPIRARSLLATLVAQAFGDYHQGGVVLLMGPAGTGKTYLAYNDVPAHIQETFPGERVETQIVPCGDPNRFSLIAAIYSQDFNPDGSGAISYKLGPWGIVIKAILEGSRGVLILDEFLNLPREAQTALNMSLSPLGVGRNKYFLLPWLPTMDASGRLTETFVKVPVKRLFVIATGNVGEGFFNEIDPSIQSRVVMIPVVKDDDLTSLAIRNTLADLELPKRVGASWANLLKAYLQALDAKLGEGMITPDIRQITARMETAAAAQLGEWESTHPEQVFAKWFDSRVESKQNTLIQEWRKALGRQLIAIAENVTNPTGELTTSGEISKSKDTYQLLVESLVKAS